MPANLPTSITTLDLGDQSLYFNHTTPALD